MSQVVLLHGSWLGDWVWADVAHRLERAGHRVTVPELSGDGNVTTHRDELLALFDSGSVATGAVVIAHSYAGMPATAAASSRPGAISKIVYLDAYVPRSEQSAFEILPGIKDIFEATVTEDGYVPPLPMEAFNITEAQLAAEIESRLRPWPLATHTTTSPGVPPSIETVFLQCAQGRFFDELSTELEQAGWTVERLDLAHMAPFTHPQETAEALLRHI